MTFTGMQPLLPASWRITRRSGTLEGIGPGAPSLQVCFECLASDATGPSGTPFLRLRWQCAALTICSQHQAPLQQICISCRQGWWPISKRTAPQRYQFFCERCGSPPSNDSWLVNEPDQYSISLLSRFECQLLRALAKRRIDWCWIGAAEPEEFLRLVEDLLWALSLLNHDLRPIYKLQTHAFPLVQPSLSYEARDHWHAVPPHIRRCFLASTLAIFGSPRARSLLLADGSHRPSWTDLIDCLETRNLAELGQRSLNWPVAAHNALRRATNLTNSHRTADPKRRVFSTGLRKTSRRVEHFYWLRKTDNLQQSRSINLARLILQKLSHK